VSRFRKLLTAFLPSRQSLKPAGPPPSDSASPVTDWRDGQRIYALGRWPDLPAKYSKAAIYKALSVMGNRRVSESWLRTHTGLPSSDFDSFVNHLLTSGVMQDVTDAEPAAFYIRANATKVTQPMPLY
jgi:hypothetical protein